MLVFNNNNLTPCSEEEQQQYSQFSARLDEDHRPAAGAVGQRHKQLNSSILGHPWGPAWSLAAGQQCTTGLEAQPVFPPIEQLSTRMLRSNHQQQ
eukprot:m.316965 g.316965  ORF g.316965 m.316965 type:complete len:95 (+) comp23078_c0_seq4:306-590(+)